MVSDAEENEDGQGATVKKPSYTRYANYGGWYGDHYFVRAACTSLCAKKTFSARAAMPSPASPSTYCATCMSRLQDSKPAPPPPATRWLQFEPQVLADLRAARELLAHAYGMAQADGFVVWADEARELATRVHGLTKKIEENAQRVLQEQCR